MERAVSRIAVVRASQQHYVFVIRATAMARETFFTEGGERGTSVIRLTSDGEGQSGREGRSEKDCRLRCESDEERDTVVDECNEDAAHIFSSSHPTELGTYRV